MLRIVPGAAFLTAALLLAPADGAGQAGPRDRQRPDAASVGRGRAIYARSCINCHGLDVKGTENGPDLIRAVSVLRDFEGSQIGPAMASAPGHPVLEGGELVDLSHFLKQQIEATARNRNALEPPDVLTGTVQAGRRFFEGAGGCAGCHSVTGDLAGIGGRYRPVDLQQRILFPRVGPRSAPVTARVRSASGETVSGTLVFIDDFFVSLTDEGGIYHSFRRSPGLVVETEDPYQAHWDLLERVRDDEIHDLVTYLETIR